MPTRKAPSAAVRRHMESKASWNQSRPAEKADFFTIGYSGRTAEEFLALLHGRGVRTLVDIRRNPVSLHRPEFSKRKLEAALEAAGIRYAHTPEFGVPKEVRTEADAAEQHGAILDWYDRNVIPDEAGLRAFYQRFEGPIALMCMEADPLQCHRHRLCLALERLGLRSSDL